MAKILIVDRERQQVGSVRFIFSQDPTQSNLFVDIDANYAATFQLADTTIFNDEGSPIASMMCGSNGKDSFGAVTHLHTRLIFGKIVNGIAERITQNGPVTLGSVSGDTVYRNHTIAGKLIVQWENDDERFYIRNLQALARSKRMSDDQTRNLIEGLRLIVYQNMMNFAGAAALITELIE